MATTLPDHYAVLTVAPTATPAEIRKAWIEQNRKWHPDKNNGSDESKRRSTEINVAYEVLGNADSRAKYDQERRGATAAAPPRSSPNPPTGGGTGTNEQTVRRPPPLINDPINQMMENLLGGGLGGSGGSRSRTATQPPAGSGGVSGGTTNTPSASAAGGGLPIIELTYEEAYAGSGNHTVTPAETNAPPCAACNGSGSAASRGLGMTTQCAACRGTGKGKPQPITVKIPSRAYDGMTVMAAPTASGGATKPVAKIRLKKHPRYERTGNENSGDLSVTVDTPYTVFALGGLLPVQTFEGTTKISVPPGTPPGERLQVRGLGLGTSNGRTGDLWVTLRAFVPKQISEKERGLLVEIAKLRGDPARGA